VTTPPSGLPQLASGVYLTDSGLETDLIFNRGLNLREFASFPLLADDAGRSTLAQYYMDHWEVADAHGAGVVFDTPTWRASPEWGERLGYDLPTMGAFNRDAVSLLREVKADAGADDEQFVISGNLGPRGDGYQPTNKMTAADAQRYHAWQIEMFAASGLPMVSIFTVNYVDEALGFANAAAETGIPGVVSYTVETNGVMPDGTSIAEAIDRVDQEALEPPAYYMLNCAHPSHIVGPLTEAADWKSRLRGFRANASRKSHAELDASDALDAGDPKELGELFNSVRDIAPSITVLGGCCGTDVRHVESIAAAVLS